MAVEWMGETPLHAYIIGHAWVWPTMEIAHFLGLCLLLGSLLIVDLRIIGFAAGVPLKAVDGFIAATLAGFGVNLATGILFIFGDPERYFVNTAFQLKMLLICFAGLNALYFTRRFRPVVRKNGDSAVLGPDSKISAILSLLFWIGVIVMGRMIPYVET